MFSVLIRVGLLLDEFAAAVVVFVVVKIEVRPPLRSVPVITLLCNFRYCN